MREEFENWKPTEVAPGHVEYPPMVSADPIDWAGWFLRQLEATRWSTR